MSKNNPPQQLHIPVLLEPTLELLNPSPNESYLDLTAGYGGHAHEIIARTGSASTATLVDRDDLAISHLQQFAREGASLIHSDFASAAQDLQQAGKRFDMVLCDLGVSSPQFDRAERGFSFQNDGFLDMRMDQRGPLTAADMVNTYSEKNLAAIIAEYGEESPRQSARIAQAIVRHRPYETTSQLADVIAPTIRGRWKIHPATRTFQALRIALNDELGQLRHTLAVLPQLVTPGGRIAIISFHSLEDRLVKRAFQELAGAGYESEFQLLTKRPVQGAIQDVHNPRARSAKLRAVVKIKRKGD